MITNLLSQLTPAEIHLIIEGKEAKLKDLMKYTLLDLLHKQVLTIEEVKHKPSRKDPVTLYHHIAPGPNFSTYNPLPHET
ncbi:MAG: hypothetical protein KDD99_19890, partial [Bacteroidetes bacterium]|nr:hypothetical protein [Bacteroidota bacterium]